MREKVLLSNIKRAQNSFPLCASVSSVVKKFMAENGGKWRILSDFVAVNGLYIRLSAFCPLRPLW